jgi:hypothetical protein
MVRNEKQIEVDLGNGRLVGHPLAVNAYLTEREAEHGRNKRWPKRPDGQVDTRRDEKALEHEVNSCAAAPGCVQQTDLAPEDYRGGVASTIVRTNRNVVRPSQGRRRAGTVSRTWRIVPASTG